MRIFASYAERDAERVTPILHGLEAMEHEVWGDDTLAPGESFTSVILRRLERADVVLVFLSEVATKSPWLPPQVEHALVSKRDADIVPVVVGDNFERHRIFPFVAGRPRLDVRALPQDEAVELIADRIEQTHPNAALSSTRVQRREAGASSASATQHEAPTRPDHSLGPDSAGSPAVASPAISARTSIAWWGLLATVVVVAVIVAVMLLRWLGGPDPSLDGEDEGSAPTADTPDLPPGAERLVLEKTRVQDLDVRGRLFATTALSGSTVERGKFDGAVMRGATLYDSRVVQSTFVSSNLVDADFRGSTLELCDFQDAVLLGADLSEATIDRTTFEGAFYDRGTRFPSDFGAPKERGLTCTDCEQMPESTESADIDDEAGTVESSMSSTSGSTGGDADAGDDTDADPSTTSAGVSKPIPIKISSPPGVPRCSAETRLAVFAALGRRKDLGNKGSIEVHVLNDGRVVIGNRRLAQKLGPVRIKRTDRGRCTVLLDLRY